MKKFAIGLLAVMTFSGAIDAQQLRFGTEASYPPFEIMNDKNEIIGFDIDIAKALCEEIQATCQFSHQAFDSLIPSLRARRIDAAIASIDVTPEREKQVTFSDIYYHNSAEFIVTSDDYTSIDSLKGKKIGLQNGTTHQKYMTEQLPDMKVMSYDSFSNAILDLKNNRLDAVFLDSAVAEDWLKKDSTLKRIDHKVTDDNYFGTGLAIALRKNNDALQQQLNQALKSIKENGKYDSIYQKWFSTN